MMNWMTYTYHQMSPVYWQRYFFIAVFLFVIGASVPAFALVYFDGIGISQCPITEGITLQIVGCVTLAIEGATFRFLLVLSQALQGTIITAIILMVTLFGVQVAMGITEIQQKTIGLLLKIGLVLTFSNNLGGFAPNVFEIMEEAALLTTNAIILGDMQCNVAGQLFNIITGISGVINNDFLNSILGAFASPGDFLWIRMDCIISKLFGLGGDMFNGFLELIGVTLFSGAMGSMTTVLGLLALWAVMTYVFYAVYIFLIAYMYVGFMIVISPIIIPMLLFNATSFMFDKWLRSILTGMAQPAFVLAYVTLTLPILDEAIFQNEEGLQALLGDDYSEYYRNQGQLVTPQIIATDDENYRNIEQQGTDYITGPRRNIRSPQYSGATDMATLGEANTVDFGEGHVETMMRLSDAAILMLFVAFTMAALLKKIPELASFIFGSFTVASAISRSTGIFSTPFAGLMSGKNSVSRIIGGNNKGSNLLGNGIPGAIRN